MNQIGNDIVKHLANQTIIQQMKTVFEDIYDQFYACVRVGYYCHDGVDRQSRIHHVLSYLDTENSFSVELDTTKVVYSNGGGGPNTVVNAIVLIESGLKAAEISEVIVQHGLVA